MSSSSSPSPRVLLLSERNAEARKWHAWQYEFEDVIAAVDDVRVVAPAAAHEPPLARLGRRVARKLGRDPLHADPALERVRVTGEYDLFFAVLHFPEDIPHLERLLDWRERCDKAVCYIAEVYDRPEVHPYLELLRRFRFDQVFLFMPREAALVSRLSGAPTAFLPVAVDALRFSPHPDPPERVVDLYQFGRRSEVTHAAALGLARDGGAFYLYDTVFNVPLPDPRAHRELIAETMKRSRYFFAYRPTQDVTRPEEESLASRYFEGVGGGTILLGEAPDLPEYRENFDWPDALIPIPYEASNLREIVADLDAQPQRLARARLNNDLATLRRHDWAYRWGQVLDAVGLPETPRMQERRERLEALAVLAEDREGAPIRP